MARRSGGRPASRDNRSASGQRQGGPSKGRGGAGGRSTQGGGRGRGAGARGGAPTRSQRPQKRDADTQSAQSRRPDLSRAGSKGDLIEGRRAVAEALELGLPVSRALIQKDQGGVDQALADLARTFEAAGVEVERVAKPILDSLSSHGAHQGVMVKVRPYRYASLADVIARAGEGNALVIVLDHVTDEGNFGAIVRTAEIVGAAGVVIANARAARVGVGAYKTSAGAVMHLPIAQVPNLATALDELKEHGFWAGGATEHAHDVIWDAPVHGRLALVMGSEGSGISRLVREHCDFEFRLPQRGVVESLNVAQATTAIAYEWLRRDMTQAEAAGGATGAAAGAETCDATDEVVFDESGYYDLPDTSDFDF